MLALDVDDLGSAEALADRLAPWFSTVKVGLELFATAGPEAIRRLRGRGLAVFADLKLHDIPTTVRRAARALAREGVGFVTFHATGGRAMLEEGRAGLLEGAAVTGVSPPVALAVTVLTSEPDVSAFGERAALAAQAGCEGVVCSAREASLAREAGLRAMVPGVRLAASPVHDQLRVTTPERALRAGADWLVVGRAVTAADDPEAAAAAVAESAIAGLVT